MITLYVVITSNNIEHLDTSHNKKDGRQIRCEQFIPAFTVRHAIADIDVAESIRESINFALKRNVRKGNISQKLARNCITTRPSAMGVTVVERGRFREGLLMAAQENGDIELPKAVQMLRLAMMLSKLLVAKTVDAGPIEFRVGTVQPFGRGEVKRSLGAIPQDWRERRQRYPEYDRDGNLNSINIMRGIKDVCVDAIEATVAVDEEFGYFTRRNVPHLTVLRNPQGFRRHERRLLSPIIASAMPPIIPLAHAAIYIPTSPDCTRIREIEVTPRTSEIALAETVPGLVRYDLPSSSMLQI